VVGQFQATLHHIQNSSPQKIFVTKNLKHNLLGLPAITALHLATQLDSTYTAMIQNSFLSVFLGLGNLGEPYTIKLQENSSPFALNTPAHFLCLVKFKLSLPRWRHKG